VLRGDGGDLMLAALALHSVDDHENASAAMRKLFTECPDTLLLRPSPSEIHQLDLLPPRLLWTVKVKSCAAQVHAPFVQAPVRQSEPVPQGEPNAQPSHPPPQSLAVSAPFWTPSRQ
jgi:hypothetical protein